MPMDYDSDFIEVAPKKEPEGWGNIPGLISEGKVFNALNIFNKALQMGRNEVESRMWLADLFEKSGGDNRDYARDQYEAVLKVDPNNIDAMSGMARLDAHREVERAANVVVEKPYDEEDDMLRRMASMPALSRQVQIGSVMGFSLILWGGGLLVLKQLKGIAFVTLEIITVILIINQDSRAWLSNQLFQLGGSSLKKQFSYDVAIFQGFVLKGVILIAVVVMLYSLLVTWMELVKNNRSGRVIYLEKDSLFINIGKNRGIEIGDKFKVVRVAEMKEKGGARTQMNFFLGTVTVDYAHEIYSKGTFQSPGGPMLQLPEKNDLVEPA